MLVRAQLQDELVERQRPRTLTSAASALHRSYCTFRAWALASYGSFSLAEAAFHSRAERGVREIQS